ncbi:MAG TPA: tetratricopeptide repeat protein [bacterium]|nr:tetratricopeptide repeat protein [bacterium]
MSTGSRLLVASIVLGFVLALAIVGCATFGPKRAPLATVPDTLDAEAKAEAFEQMAKTYPEDAELFFTLGNVYYDQAIPDLAKQNYEKAISLDHKMDKARVNLAMVIAESGDPDSAKVILEDVVKRDPKNSKALVDLGMIYYDAKDVDTAVKYYSKALAINPRDPEAHYDLGMAFAESGLLLEAVKEFRAVLDIQKEGDTAQRAQLALERVEGTLKK